MQYCAPERVAEPMGKSPLVRGVVDCLREVDAASHKACCEELPVSTVSQSCHPSLRRRYHADASLQQVDHSICALNRAALIMQYVCSAGDDSLLGVQDVFLAPVGLRCGHRRQQAAAARSKATALVVAAAQNHHGVSELHSCSHSAHFFVQTGGMYLAANTYLY